MRPSLNDSSLDVVCNKLQVFLDHAHIRHMIATYRKSLALYRIDGLGPSIGDSSGTSYRLWMDR